MTAPAEPAYHRRVVKDGNATMLRRFGFDSKESRSRALPVLGVTHHFIQRRASGPPGRAAGMRRDFGMKAGEDDACCDALMARRRIATEVK
jgi:hypothetical protein